MRIVVQRSTCSALYETITLHAHQSDHNNKIYNDGEDNRKGYRGMRKDGKLDNYHYMNAANIKFESICPASKFAELHA